MSSIRDRLKGGDLRSTGAADEIAREVENNPNIFGDLVRGLDAMEPVVRMRCADAMEKVTRKYPCWLEEHSAKLLQLLDKNQPKELLWHVLQMVPRISWPPSKHVVLFDAVEACLGSSSSIVKVSAMQALYELTLQAPSRAGKVKMMLVELSRTGTPAMKARGNKLLRIWPDSSSFNRTPGVDL